jgi:Zn-finger nucleic acid-binding protein
MKPLKIGDVQVDEYLQCRGIWFDKGELAEAKDGVDPDLRWLDFGKWEQEARFQINDQPLKCPRCLKFDMRAFNCKEPVIEFAFCPFCENLWLNAGDFKQILDAFGKEVATKSVSDYLTASLKEGSEIITNPCDQPRFWIITVYCRYYPKTRK